MQEQDARASGRAPAMLVQFHGSKMIPICTISRDVRSRRPPRRGRVLRIRGDRRRHPDPSGGRAGALRRRPSGRSARRSRPPRWRRSSRVRSRAGARTSVGRVASSSSAALLAGVGALGQLLAPSLAWLVAARLLIGAGEGALFTAAITWVLATAPPDRRGRIVGHFGLSMWGGLALGPPLAAALAAATSDAVVWWACVLAPIVPALAVAAGGLRLGPGRHPLRTRPLTKSMRSLTESTVPRTGVRNAVTRRAARSRAGWRRAARPRGAARGRARCFPARPCGPAWRSPWPASATGRSTRSSSCASKRPASAAPGSHSARSARRSCSRGCSAARWSTVSPPRHCSRAAPPPKRSVSPLIALAPTAAVAFAGIVLTGLGTALVYPTLATLVATRAAQQQHGAAVGALTSSWDVGLALAGPVGGALGAHGAFALAAALALAAGVPRLTVLTGRSRASPPAHSRAA